MGKETKKKQTQKNSLDEKKIKRFTDEMKNKIKIHI